MRVIEVLVVTGLPEKNGLSRALNRIVPIALSALNGLNKRSSRPIQGNTCSSPKNQWSHVTRRVRASTQFAKISRRYSDDAAEGPFGRRAEGW
jgi:hypothetical protein